MLITQKAIRDCFSLFSWLDIPSTSESLGLKQTGQRDAVRSPFLEQRDQLSTDGLRKVKKKDAKIGFTTVYRTLKLFAECGLASEVAFHDGIARYDALSAVDIITWYVRSGWGCRLNFLLLN